MTRAKQGASAGVVIVFLLLLAADRLGIITIPRGDRRAAPTSQRSDPVGHAGSSGVQGAFAAKRSDVWIEDEGEVVKLLADDTEGVAHQKFLVRIGDSLTVLVAHSLAAAERVPVREGDRVRFRGEYEWTEKGGTVHFTHAPEQARREPGGWIEFGGRRYE
jgi:hypothetical protein